MDKAVSHRGLKPLTLIILFLSLAALAGRYVVADGDTLASIARQHGMNYPELAIETGIQGKVTVKVLVGPDGNVIKVGSLSGPEVFHSEVKDKARQLQFTPGLQSNKPVKVWVNVPFSFKLN